MEENNKTEEQIREEAKKEFMEQQQQEELEKLKGKKRRKKVFNFIYKTIATLLVLFILFETVMGILNMNRLNDDKEPLWYIDKKIENVDNKKETTYNIGLYVIKKVEDNQEKKIMLKPFFIQE